MSLERLLFATLAVSVAAWFKKRSAENWAPCPEPQDPADSPRRRDPPCLPSLSEIDSARLRDDHGCETRYRTTGQREGIAKLLTEDPDA